MMYLLISRRACIRIWVTGQILPPSNSLPVREGEPGSRDFNRRGWASVKDRFFEHCFTSATPDTAAWRYAPGVRGGLGRVAIYPPTNSLPKGGRTGECSPVLCLGIFVLFGPGRPGLGRSNATFFVILNSTLRPIRPVQGEQAQDGVQDLRVLFRPYWAR